MDQMIIEVKDVEREYKTKMGFFAPSSKTVKALQGISFSVKEGEMFGLLGPNGAGKTTLIKILTTLLIPSAGSVRILGLDPVTQYKELRPQINFILGGERNLYWRLSAYDNLAYFSDLYKVPRLVQRTRIWELLEKVGLQDVAHQKVETFSKGMKQKLQIARGLVNQPKILFLDEPSIGLDPVSARQLRDILRELNELGTTIVITTHYMYEADELCERIAFVNQGKLIALDTPDNLKKFVDSISVVDCTIIGLTEIEIENFYHIPDVLHVQFKQIDHYVNFRFQTRKPHSFIPLLYQILDGKLITSLSISTPTLEDAYISIVGGRVS